MAKQRIIQTKFWSDPYIQGLLIEEKILYFYLFTNEQNIQNYMKIGTLTCRLVGHNFKGKRRVYEPHYLDLVKRGIAVTMFPSDYHYVGFVTKYCVRCGCIEDKTEQTKTKRI